MKSFREFLFERQGGKCYLMSTQECVRLGGQMRFGGKHKGDYASWEHVIPRSKSKGQRSLRLLSCCRCNTRKGADDPAPEHVDLARSLEADYMQLWWASMSPRTQRRHIARAMRARLSEDAGEPTPAEAIAATHFAQVVTDKDMREARKRREHQKAIEAEAARRRKALGISGKDARARAKRLQRMRQAASRSLGWD